MIKDLLGVISPFGISNLVKPVYDNGIFQLHYKFTVIVLITASIMISSKQFFGEPIKCIGDKNKSGDVADTYCWIHGTFTLRNQYADKESKIGQHSAHPGVRPYSHYDDEITHKYYQWICIILFLQAALFYFPHYLWKIWEGNRMRSLSSELKSTGQILEKWNEPRKNDMVRYFVEPNGHSFYVIRFMICEIMNLANVIGQIMLLNSFLGGSFLNYGPAVASFLFQSTDLNSTDPMAWMFPKVTKCTFQVYGPSGGVQEYDFMCVLPLNIVNEKVYAVLWFWFVILAILSGIAVIYRFLTFMSPHLRMYCLLSEVRSLPKFQIRNVVKKLSIGNWFVLCQLGKNVNTNVVKDLIIELNRALERKSELI